MTKNIGELVKDYVCGMTKPKSEMKAVSTYQGKIYYFCSDDDKHMFDAYPDRWIPSNEKVKENHE